MEKQFKRSEVIVNDSCSLQGLNKPRQYQGLTCDWCTPTMHWGSREVEMTFSSWDNDGGSTEVYLLNWVLTEQDLAKHRSTGKKNLSVVFNIPKNISVNANQWVLFYKIRKVGGPTPGPHGPQSRISLENLSVPDMDLTNIWDLTNGAGLREMPKMALLSSDLTLEWVLAQEWLIHMLTCNLWAGPEHNMSQARQRLVTSCWNLNISLPGFKWGKWDNSSVEKWTDAKSSLFTLTSN